tara:strand:+ start:234 stop:392 length:159 start_codon:yes stop_codon:yes gene_type:complete
VLNGKTLTQNKLAHSDSSINLAARSDDANRLPPKEEEEISPRSSAAAQGMFG